MSVILTTYPKFTNLYLTYCAASFVDSNGKSTVLLRSDFQGSEKRLLLHISSKLIGYDWSIGWNSTGHINNLGSVETSDLSILRKRCIANSLESIVSLGQKGVPYIKGRKHIDLCNVYRKMMVQVTIYNNSYRTHKLDEVSKVLLGYGKYKNFSGLDFKNLPIEEQIEYSLRDSELVMKLSKHENYEVLDALCAVSEITELDYEQVCRTNLSTWWGAIFDKMVKNGMLVKTSFSGTYKGAEVLEPKQGFYHNVVVVDATSLYPSVGINYNLSFDTINCKCCRDDPKAKLSATLDDKFLKDCKFVNKDSWICKKEIGAFPRKLRLFKSERLKQKDLGNKPKQLALKILINGGYGVFGDNRYDYYDPRVAELVTALGRQTLSKMQSIAKDLGFKIIYGDTDSLFFNRELDIELGIKNTYFNCILSKGKKHYIGYGLNDKNKDTLDIVGMEGKKSDRPQFVNNAFKQLVNDVVRHNIDPVPKLRCAISDLDSNKIVDADLLKISKVLGDNPEDYKSQTCQSATIGKALGKSKGELIEYFVSNLKKTGSSWSTNPSDIDTKWYKQSLWNTVSEVLQIAGYPTEILAKEFGVTNPNKKSKSTNGHSDAEPPCE